MHTNNMNQGGAARNEQTARLQTLNSLNIATQATTEVSNSTESAGARSLLNVATVNNNSVAQWKADALGQNPVQWGQQLLAMLNDKVQLQMGQQLQKAQIRLDPPNLGTIDITISVENDKTTVNLVASHQQVREALQQTIDQLRQSLGAKLSTEVSVSTQSENEGRGGTKQSSTASQDDAIAGQWLEPDKETISPVPMQPNNWLNRLI